MDHSMEMEEDHGSSENESDSSSSRGSQEGSVSPQREAVKNEEENRSERSRSSSPRSNKSFSGSASSHSRSVSPAGSHSAHSEKADNSDEEKSNHSLSGQSSRASSRSRSVSPAGNKTPVNETLKLADDSRSQSPNLQIDDQSRSPAHSDAQSDARSEPDLVLQTKRESKSRSRSGTRSPAHSDSHHSESDARSRSSRSRSPSTSKNIKTPDSNNSEKAENEKINAQDIFGDADDISLSGDEERKSSADSEFHDEIPKKRSRANSIDSKRSRSRSSSRSRTPATDKSHSRSASPGSPHKETAISKENEGETNEEIRIEVEIPRIVTNLGKEIHFVKLPNFLSVEMRPFDADTYEDEIDEEETMDEEGRQRIKLKVSNTIRWREYMNNEGRMIKESNARFVRWSDGSQTLHLGNEMFDVYRQPLHGDHNHMFIRQGTGLQGQAVFRTKLTFRPHSTESFTHKKMTMSLADRSQKTSGIKILTQVGKDPTTDRRYNLKKEEEKLRQAMRSQHKPQAKKKKTAGAHRDASFSYQHDDGSDDENSVSINEIKNKYKKMAKAGISTARSGDPKASAIYSSDDDEGSDFEGRRKKVDKAKIVKALRDSDSESNVESEEAGTEKNAKSSDEKSNDGNDSD